MKDTKINLCDNCLNSIPTCNPIHIEFSDGVGNDNVIECDEHLPTEDIQEILIEIETKRKDDSK